ATTTTGGSSNHQRQQQPPAAAATKSTAAAATKVNSGQQGCLFRLKCELGRNDDGLPEEEPNKFQVFRSACKLTGRRQLYGLYLTTVFKSTQTSWLTEKNRLIT
ncbi:hypothetical protein Tco_1087675, partial [Tanacetum coccineum]